ncbi:hypothetical protein NL676_005379 [Syzygium grande]|nr:hypothetical protein NL676_005379 [Syzygium grande]
MVGPHLPRKPSRTARSGSSILRFCMPPTGMLDLVFIRRWNWRSGCPVILRDCVSWVVAGPMDANDRARHQNSYWDQGMFFHAHVHRRAGVP